MQHFLPKQQLFISVLRSLSLAFPSWFSFFFLYSWLVHEFKMSFPWFKRNWILWGSAKCQAGECQVRKIPTPNTSMISSMLLSRLPGNLDSLYPLLTIYQCQVVRPNENILGWNTANQSNYLRCRDVTHILYFVMPDLSLIKVIGKNAS